MALAKIPRATIYKLVLFSSIVNEYQYAAYNKVKVDANELKLLQGVYMYHIEVSSATASYNSIGKIIFER